MLFQRKPSGDPVAGVQWLRKSSGDLIAGVRWLKKKLNTDGIQLVSITHDFKFQAPDGKQRFADALDSV